MKFLLTILCLLSSLNTIANLVIYSSRNEQLIKPLFDAYSKTTGTNIEYITAKEGPLIERLKAEGKNTKADILLTVDAGNLWLAENLDLLQSVDSKILQNNIPPHLQSSSKKWFGFSIRARTIFYNKSKVKPAELSTYKDLANKKWKNKLCLRTSKKVYNQSLIAMMLKEEGKKTTETTVSSWIKNLAAPVFSNDTKLLKAIHAGQCQIGIANTYYYGRLLKKDPNLNIGIFWPNQTKNSGVHVNVSGAGVTKYAKNKKEAIRFLEWLSEKQAQKLFADSNLEYPANPAVSPVALVKKWGKFKANPLNLSFAGKLQPEAVKLMDRAKYK